MKEGNFFFGEKKVTEVNRNMLRDSLRSMEMKRGFSCVFDIIFSTGKFVWKIKKRERERETLTWQLSGAMSVIGRERETFNLKVVDWSLTMQP